MARLTLISGGCRSGKSRFALREASTHPGLRTFIATCPRMEGADDGEMEARISKHQIERGGAGWKTVEEELNVARRLRQLDRHQEHTAVIDCLTLWVNNQMFHAARERRTINEDEIAEKAMELIAASAFQGFLYVVTGEVGLGIVPDNKESRLFRDLLGRCNQVLAQEADDVFFMVSGIPLKIK